MTEINLNRDAYAVLEAPAQPAYTGVRIYVGRDADGTDLYYSAGSTNGSVLEVENPWGTQSIANGMLAAISGYAYRPMEADQALLDPAAELGDAVTVNRVYTVLAKCDTKYGSLLVSDIAAPNDGELNHEYPYEVKENREMRREIAQASSSLIVELDEIKGQVTDDQGNYTVVTIKSDGLYVGGEQTTLDGSNITARSIGTTQIAGGAIKTENLAAYAVTASELSANAVTASKLATDAVQARNIDSEAVRTDNLLLTGMLDIYDSTGKSRYARIGYGTGADGSGNSTYGAKMQAGSNYIIVTNAGARMQAGSGYIYTANNTCHCSSAFVADSDASIKTDVDDDLTDYKAALMSLRPVSFEYIPERGMGDNRYTGLIAQEAEAVIAEHGLDEWALASVNGEGIHGVCYEQLVPVLVACMQDMAKEIAELKERING